MRLVSLAGPPSAGKTSLLVKTIKELSALGLRSGAGKFDCLSSRDADAYRRAGIPVQLGLSANLCPDHYFISNVEAVYDWALSLALDFLFTESAGLCNRCAPHVVGALAICVLDNLSGVDTPDKIGPMLKTADIVVVTKGDIVSQAEREVFAYRVGLANPRAEIVMANGITGQGCFDLSQLILQRSTESTLHGSRLRFPVTAAICSYCLGERKIGTEYQKGNVRRIQIEPEGTGDA